jgi:hypothetical protein
MAGKSKGPNPVHQCCIHIAAVSGFNPGPDGKPAWIAQANVCCHCGQATVSYVGVVEQGHGPFVSYQPAPERVAQARTKLLLPGHA